MSDILHGKYKEEKETFVSNLSGSSLYALILVLWQIPTYTLLTKLLLLRFNLFVSSSTTSKRYYKYCRHSIEILFLVLPITFSLTLFAAHNEILLFVGLGFSLWNIFVLLKQHNSNSENNYDNESEEYLNSKERKPYITDFKGEFNLLDMQRKIF